MTLEQVYFVTQIVAAIVLIASIFFLALQVRQNSKLLARSMNEDNWNSQNALWDQIAFNREFAELHMKIGNDYDSLDDVDKYRAYFQSQKTITNMLHSVEARADGDLPDRQWRELQARIRFGMKRKNAQNVWKNIRNNYPKRVQDLFEEAANS